MGELVGQVWELQAGEQVFASLDLRAQARWPKEGSPTVDVVVNHPGPILRGIVDAREERISVRAGYQRDQGAVEIGGGLVVVDSITLDRSSPDRPYEFQLSARGVTRQIILSAAWGAVSASQVLEYVRQQVGLAADIQLGTDRQYTRYDITGGFTGILDRLARDTGSEWEVDGSTLRMWPAGQGRRQTADVWSPSTGLMRVSGTGTEIRAMALLRPSLRPGDIIRISDAGYDGDVIVVDATHEIDTFGGAFTTQITGRPR